MKKEHLLLFLLAIATTTAFPQNNYFEGKLVVNPHMTFDFPNAGKKILVEPSAGRYDSISCLLKINNDSIRILQSGKAKYKNDTLSLTMYNLDPAYGGHTCSIKIANDRFQANYDFAYVMDDVPFKRQIRIRESKLIIKSKKFATERKIAGYFEIDVDCQKGCLEKSGETHFVISGNFKLSIQK